QKLKYGTLEIDLFAQSASVADYPLELTAKEFDLLAALGERFNQVVSRNQLNGLLYELNEEPESNSLNVLAGRLRRKLQGTGLELATIRNKGFVVRLEKSST